MKHKKILVAVATTAMVGISSPAIAAELSNGSGQTCDHATLWHFVNNQTGGAPAGTITVEFSDGVIYQQAATLVNKNTQHFDVQATSGATLVHASTGNLPGRLVLSHTECEDTKKK